MEFTKHYITKTLIVTSKINKKTKLWHLKLYFTKKNKKVKEKKHETDKKCNFVLGFSCISSIWKSRLKEFRKFSKKARRWN